MDNVDPVHPNASLIVTGIDVGAPRKGFHAIALKNGVYLGQEATSDAGELVKWCRNVGAQVIGVDAPCKWSSTGRARAAERALMSEGIWCFSTPTQAVALAHPIDHYGWMRAGAELFRKLALSHQHYSGGALPAGQCVCFETFPHAITCALRGEIVSAKKKRRDRSALLAEAGINLPMPSSMDMIDAALCALVAQQLAAGTTKCYGDAESGLIVVPARAG